MILMKYYFSFLAVLFTCLAISQATSRIIPQPSNLKLTSGYLQLEEALPLVASSELNGLMDYVTTTLKNDFGILAKVDTESRTSPSMEFILDKKKSKDAEGTYRLVVDNSGITISSGNEAGLFYGLQSLRQLMGPNRQVPFTTIEDAPRFPWRAVMLDEGRYFQGKEQVLKILDEMARLKMNIFHWHLVDDQGWRIEIKKYPKLTSVGSKRPSTQVGPLKWNSPIQSGEPHEGYYTQEDVSEILAYAQKRHITVVPEIEMPGHASAAIAAYPWLGTAGKAIDVPIWFGVSKDIFNVTDPKVFSFLTDVLDEIMQLFPSKIIHIGGDEAKYDHWKNSPQVQEYMKENNINSFSDLQVNFTNRISAYLNSKGRRMMGWNEILGHTVHDYQAELDSGAETELSKSSVVHFWKGDLELMQSAAEQGYDIVNSLHTETYLDYAYDEIPLKKAYDFDPIPKGLDATYHSRIKGIGCQMWGEWIPKSGYMDFLLFPRLAAYAEVAWTEKEDKDYTLFKKALEPIMSIWEEKGIYFAPLEFAEPGSGTWEKPE